METEVLSSSKIKYPSILGILSITNNKVVTGQVLRAQSCAGAGGQKSGDINREEEIKSLVERKSKKRSLVRTVRLAVDW